MIIGSIEDYMEELKPWDNWDHSARSVFCLMFLPILVEGSDAGSISEARFVNIKIFGNYGRRPPEFVVTYFHRMPSATRSSIYPSSIALRKAMLRRTPRPANWPSVA